MKRLWVALLFLGVALVLFIGTPALSGGEKNPCIEQLVKLSVLRFTDNGDGTVTDNWTRLVWMKNASYVENVADGFDVMDWEDACTACATLNSNEHGLTDGSGEGDWRLPSVRELHSLVDYGVYSLALPTGHPFDGVQNTNYWSSTTFADDTSIAWVVHLGDGSVGITYKSMAYSYVWCVRGGK